MEFRKKPIIGITIGDFNGIGPEVIMKSLSSGNFTRYSIPVIYGSAKVMAKSKNQLGVPNFYFNQIRNIKEINPKKINLINSYDGPFTLDYGLENEDAGACAMQSLEAAADDLAANKIDAVVTGPISKANIQKAGFKHPGHTEFFRDKLGADDMLMLLCAESLRVAVATAHIPYKQVPEALNPELIVKKVEILNKSLKQDFGIRKPKIALLGLNPHAGEQGILGSEEDNIILPAIEECKKRNILVIGPFPADGYFGALSWQQFDATIAMYHDQGLIPFKTVAFNTGTNYTAGLKAIRTSPDHGTAFDIAGKNEAHSSAMTAAIFQAIDIFKNRKEAFELESNALNA